MRTWCDDRELNQATPVIPAKLAVRTQAKPPLSCGRNCSKLVKLGMARDLLRMARRARRQRFQILVQRVVSSLSSDVQHLLDNVAIIVAAEPTANQRRESELAFEDDLFGLYQGVPKSERGSGYSMVAPDQITIFMGPLERAYGSRVELEEQVRITVLHELGHHLGFDEDGLDSIGLA